MEKVEIKDIWSIYDIIKFLFKEHFKMFLKDLMKLKNGTKKKPKKVELYWIIECPS